MTSMMRTTLLATLASLALACDNKPTENKSTAQVAEPAAVAKPVAGVSFKFSAADSKVGFVGAKVTGKHDGGFNAFSGAIVVPDGDLLKGSVTVDIDVNSLFADNPKLAGHLKSEELFDAAKFPRSKFVSTGVKAGGERGASHTVTGNLELHGVTKSISFPATIKLDGDKVTVDAEFGINRKDFGIVYPGKPDDLIKDEVLIKLALKASKG